MILRRFESDLEGDWNRVVEKSRNGVFLFQRDYLSYHQDRFQEISLIAYSGDVPVAILPANRVDNEATSHSGLTFGGVIYDKNLRFEQVSDVLDKFLLALSSSGIERLTIKLVPEYLWNYPAGEIPYLLWRRGFRLSRRDLSQLLPLENSLPFNKSKRAAVQRAEKSGLSIQKDRLDQVHALITRVLEERHGVSPVHSTAELALLRSRFPEHILLRSALHEDSTLAAAVVYRYGSVWHTQYLASSDEGRELGALDLLISEIMGEARKAGATALSFGGSTEQGGTRVNPGLAWQKESFGARSVCHDFVTGSI